MLLVWFTAAKNDCNSPNATALSHRSCVSVCVCVFAETGANACSQAALIQQREQKEKPALCSTQDLGHKSGWNGTQPIVAG